MLFVNINSFKIYFNKRMNTHLDAITRGCFSFLETITVANLQTLAPTGTPGPPIGRSLPTPVAPRTRDSRNKTDSFPLVMETESPRQRHTSTARPYVVRTSTVRPAVTTPTKRPATTRIYDESGSGSGDEDLEASGDQELSGTEPGSRSSAP